MSRLFYFLAAAFVAGALAKEDPKATVHISVGPEEVKVGDFIEAGGRFTALANLKDAVFQVKLPKDSSKIEWTPKTAGSFAKAGTVNWPLGTLPAGTKIDYVVKAKANSVGHKTVEAILKSKDHVVAHDDDKVNVFEDESAEILATLIDWVTTVTSGKKDVAALTAAKYAWDVVFLPTVSPSIRNQSATQEYFEYFATQPGLRVVPPAKGFEPVIIINQYAPYIGSADGFIYLTTDANYPAVTRARFSFIYRKNWDGKWKIILHHNSVIPTKPEKLKEKAKYNILPPPVGTPPPNKKV